MKDVEKGKMLAQLLGFTVVLEIHGCYWIIYPPRTWVFEWWTNTHADEAYLRVLDLCLNYEDNFVSKSD